MSGLNINIKEMYNHLQKGLWSFIHEAPEELIEVMIDYRQFIETSWRYFLYDRKHIWIKVIYFKNEKVQSQEIDLCSYEGSKLFCWIQENCDDQSHINILQFCHEVGQLISEDLY